MYNDLGGTTPLIKSIPTPSPIDLMYEAKSLLYLAKNFCSASLKLAFISKRKHSFNGDDGIYTLSLN